MSIQRTVICDNKTTHEDEEGVSYLASFATPKTNTEPAPDKDMPVADNRDWIRLNNLTREEYDNLSVGGTSTLIIR